MSTSSCVRGWHPSACWADAPEQAPDRGSRDVLLPPCEESAGIRFQKDHLGCEGHPFHSVLRQASYLCSQGSASVLPVARCGCAVPFCIVPRREETDSFSLSPDFSAKILVIPRGNFRVEITCSPSYLLLWESVGDEEAPRFASALAEGSGGTLW